jgi:hypothetical protein
LGNRLRKSLQQKDTAALQPWLMKDGHYVKQVRTN